MSYRKLEIWPFSIFPNFMIDIKLIVSLLCLHIIDWLNSITPQANEFLASQYLSVRPQ